MICILNKIRAWHVFYITQDKLKKNKSIMKNTINEKAERIKKTIHGSAEKSREAIREIIKSNSKHIDSALDSNKKIIDSFKTKFNHEHIDSSITDTVKKTFGKSIELSEDSIDSIINGYSKQMEFFVDFNTKLVEAIQEISIGGNEKALELIHENFEKLRLLTINNTHEIIDSYNKHTNLALNFNKKFSDNVSTQIESFSKLRDNNIKMFSGWTSEWWKEGREKNATV
jgi:hypothetical protein